MTTLGAVLAGGRSSRFGSDKAFAQLHGRALIEHACAALAVQCDEVVVIGREGGLPDWPAPDFGPLGGVAGALLYAFENGHAQVLTCGVDSVGLPRDLLARLSPGPAYMADQPVIGLWPVTARGVLAQRLSLPNHAMRAFVDDLGARAVTVDQPLANVNTRADLARLELQHGL